MSNINAFKPVFK